MPGLFVPKLHCCFRFRRVAAGIIVLSLLWAGPAARAASRPEVRGEQAMVSSPEQEASQAGLAVLRAGGNAVDAAVAVAFTLAVTYPLGGNLGGGGFMLYRAGPDEHHALDFRETAPAAIEAGMFLDAEGRPVPELSLDGGLAVGVPGSVAGLAEAHRLWGSRPWKELLKPAIALAESGIEVYPFLVEALRWQSDKIDGDPEARRIFTRDGRGLQVGDRLVQTDLGTVLRRIARRGAGGFYEGETADAIVRSVRSAGGVMTAADMTAYRPILRPPVEGRYRGYRVVGFPPPSSGGVAILQILGMLERFDLKRAGFGSSATAHLMAEAERRAFADRSVWLGDADFVDVPLVGLLEPEYLARRSADIALDRATPSANAAAGRPSGGSDGETLHFSVADSRGRAVAFTTTLNGWFGNGIVAPGTGVFLNNEMDDFAMAPDAPNLYGLLGGEANAVEGGKRPLSSMSPTIVELPDGGPRPALILGSPGGSTIITTVVQVLINVLDHGMPLQEAVDAPRFHHQWQPDRIAFEARAFPEDVRRNLSSRGHELHELSRPLGNCNAIALGADGAWRGAADPRRHGSAAGF